MTFLLISRTIFVIVCQPQMLVGLASALCGKPPHKDWDSCEDTIKKITIPITTTASPIWLESLLENMVESSALVIGFWKRVTPYHPRAKCSTNSVCLPLHPWTATKVSKTKGSSHADWPLRVLWGSFCCVEQSRSFFCHPILSNSNLHALLGSHPSSTKVPCDELLEFLDLCDYFLDLITATFHARFCNLCI